MLKVGDKVRRKKAFQTGSWTLGDSVLTVTKISYYRMLSFEGADGMWSPDFFDLIKELGEEEIDHDLLFEVKSQYWLDFSKLVRETLDKVPEHMRDDLMAMMQRSSSVYASKHV